MSGKMTEQEKEMDKKVNARSKELLIDLMQDFIDSCKGMGPNDAYIQIFAWHKAAVWILANTTVNIAANYSAGRQEDFDAVLVKLYQDTLDDLKDKVMGVVRAYKEGKSTMELKITKEKDNE